MLDEVFGSSYNNQDIEVLNSSGTLKKSVLADILTTQQRVKTRKQSVLILQGLMKSKSDNRVKLMRALTKWKEASLETQVQEILQENQRQNSELYRIKQAHLATVQSFVNSKKEMENKLMRMGQLVASRI